MSKAKGKLSSIKSGILTLLIPIVTFVIFVFIFAAMSNVNIMAALDPPPDPALKELLEETETHVEEPLYRERPFPSDSAWAELEEEKERLEKLKEEVQHYLAVRESAKSEDLKSLANLYDSIGREKLAEIFSNMDDTLVAKVIPLMKSRGAAKVLAFMEPERAAKISRMIMTREEE
ncbi:MAG: hypothetical protein GF307_07515 [candidate division Zixibacteria bacterium]|nr:hypothetical protein [candidate division Zixibacteria bacterium]